MSLTVALLLVERLPLIPIIPFPLPRHLLLLLVLPYRAAQNSHIKRLFYACVCVRVHVCVRVCACKRVRYARGLEQSCGNSNPGEWGVEVGGQPLNSL